MALSDSLVPLFEAAFARRAGLFDDPDGACRLFHGPTEGRRAWVVELFARTLVVFGRDDATVAEAREVADYFASRIARVKCAVWKSRDRNRETVVLFGKADTSCVEDHTLYALDLFASHDATFYLDTELLRRELRASCAGEHVLNTFAYTGSLSVAAMAGSAARVLSVDRNKDYLAIAKRSFALNRFPVRRIDFIARDVFTQAGSLRKTGELFDTVIVDPPFFSAAKSGSVDVARTLPALLDKLRPLVADGGRLITVVNGLFVPGTDLMQVLNERAPWITVEKIVDVPAHVSIPDKALLPADPSPFTHPTKMAIARVKRKDGRKRGS